MRANRRVLPKYLQERLNSVRINMASACSKERSVREMGYVTGISFLILALLMTGALAVTWRHEALDATLRAHRLSGDYPVLPSDYQERRP